MFNQKNQPAPPLDDGQPEDRPWTATELFEDTLPLEIYAGECFCLGDELDAPRPAYQTLVVDDPIGDETATIYDSLWRQN